MVQQTEALDRALAVVLWSAWCAQVTVVPEVSRIRVFSSGKCQGSKVIDTLRRPKPPVKATAYILEVGNIAELK